MLMILALFCVWVCAIKFYCEAKSMGRTTLCLESSTTILSYYIAKIKIGSRTHPRHGEDI